MPIGLWDTAGGHRGKSKAGSEPGRTPKDSMVRLLMRFGAELRRDWREAMKDAPEITVDDVDSVVDDVLGRVRGRRREIALLTAVECWVQERRARRMN